MPTLSQLWSSIFILIIFVRFFWQVYRRQLCSLSRYCGWGRGPPQNRMKRWIGGKLRMRLMTHWAFFTQPPSHAHHEPKQLSKAANMARQPGGNIALRSKVKSFCNFSLYMKALSELLIQFQYFANWMSFLSNHSLHNIHQLFNRFFFIAFFDRINDTVVRMIFH